MLKRPSALLKPAPEPVKEQVEEEEAEETVMPVSAVTAPTVAAKKKSAAKPSEVKEPKSENNTYCRTAERSYKDESGEWEARHFFCWLKLSSRRSGK